MLYGHMNGDPADKGNRAHKEKLNRSFAEGRVS
jgi:hypothetical protein